MTTRRMAAAWLAGSAAWAVGCSSSVSRIEPPTYSETAAVDALAAYDKNKDGTIAGDELAKCPGLKAALAQVDRNGDKKISAEEIDASLREWRDSRVAVIPIRLTVTLDDAPLVGAIVTLEPESFLGSNVPAGTGTTVDGGSATVSMPKERLADPSLVGVSCGWYKVRITHPSKAIPPRYNTETILGCEVAMNAHWVNDGEVKLVLTR